MEALRLIRFYVTVRISVEFDFSGTLCGITSDFHAVDTGQFFIKAWDNNKFKVHEDDSLVVTDNNNGGALLLDASLTSNNQGDFSSGPRSIQVNADGVCSNGALFSFHGGNTFHRDGTVTDHHISLV